MSVQEDIDTIFDENGPLSNRQSVPEGILSSNADILPDILIEIWKQHGIGSWGSGIFNLCLPSDFEGLLSQIFHADSDFSHRDSHVIGYSAFGELYVWSERHWLVEVSMLDNTISCSDLLYPEKKVNQNTPISILIYDIASDASLNYLDDNNKPLFARAKKKLGVLEPGECYGFAPALAMGGAPNLQNLSKMKAYEHFLFLAQLQNFTLMDYLSRPIRAVRQIG